MKKILFAVMALGMSLVSCTNEEIPAPAVEYGYINVNVSNDPIVQTRATAVRNLTGWILTANDGTSDKDISNENKVVAGTYTVSAKSHASQDAALTASNGWGEAYYEGSVSNIVVTSGGTTDAPIDCGKAKNGRIKVTFSLPSVFTDYKVTVDPSSRNLEITSDSQVAYFNAGEVVYTLSYKYDGGDTKTVSGTIDVAAATEHTISVSANDNGRINVTVNVDDSFDQGTGADIEFDAATGEKVEKS